MMHSWDEHRIDQGNGAARADFFDLTMLRCMYHAVVPAFETRIERDVDEMTKRRFLRRLEEVGANVQEVYARETYSTNPLI